MGTMRGMWHPDELEARLGLEVGRASNVYAVLDLSAPWLRRCLAVHEAGHAVAGVCGGAAVASMRIADDLGRGAAGTDPHVPQHAAAAIDWRPRTIKLYAQVTLAAAGVAAQMIWLADEGLLTERREWALHILGVEDRRKALETFHSLGGELSFGGKRRGGAGLWSWYHERATRVLREGWDQVIGLAEALDTAGHLDGDDVHSLLEHLWAGSGGPR